MIKGFKYIILSLTLITNLVSNLPIAHAQFDAAAQQVIDGLITLAKKRALDAMVDQTIDYINGSTSGKPQFISDWRGFLDTTAQVAVGDVVKALGLGALCSPFRLQVQLAMIAPPRFSKQVNCTLGSIIRNVNNFYSDFRNGGWLAYQELWAPNNNFYGSLLLAWNAKENEVAARLQAANNEALANRGFLSMKKCQKDENGKDIPRTCVVATPGTVFGAQLEKAMSSDFDFILSSHDAGIYSAAIADALINRMIRSGVEGLGGIVQAQRPPITSANTIGCFNLIGRAKDDCLKYQNQYGTSYTQNKATAAQIAAALESRLAAQKILNDLATVSNSIVTKLNNLMTCQFGKNKDTQETRALLTQQQQNLSKYYQAKSQNDWAIQELKNNNNSFGISPLIANPDEAKKFLTDQQAELNVNQQSLINLDNNLSGKITQCQNG